MGPPPCPSVLSPSARGVSPLSPTMLFWHGQPEPCWSSPGDVFPLPASGALRDPPVLPCLKQEEPKGVPTWQPPFRYILCAPTSPAVRHHEETLTYLNQGQPYEIRMMGTGTARGDPAEGRRVVKSLVRVVFHDRRLQYSEQQQLEGWRWSRPGDRILDIDIPLSVGILEPQIHPTLLNTVEFLWDPSRRTSVFVQVHCISTEFTLRKNGGEKGVPFRIQIDTFGVGGKGDPPEHLHSASCLVKVFKPKGADRKQRTEREKVEKQPAAEREKFQPPYESTVLAECPPWLDALGAPHSPPGLPAPHPFKLLSPESASPVSPACAAEGPAGSPGEALSPCASPLETQQWLLRRRFSSCARVFANFTGADLLKLSRRDLIQICGAPDGIRLCHALAGRCPRPRLTLYVTREPGGAESAEGAGSGLYQELHLQQLTVPELTARLAQLLGLPPGQILRLSRQGPAGIHVLVSDAMIRNLQDETRFVVAIGKAPGPEGFQLLLR
ncbi:transcription factor CP2-like protein 1 isoform X4 [Agelaius phoeniceus]|uniref:transcription factor CP2-like protein 1 isoform X4 n=1 Tax=Agelaius phoeniceus TaxID=39638 RepID=UPI004054EEDD